MRQTFQTISSPPEHVTKVQNFDIASHSKTGKAKPVRPQLLSKNLAYPEVTFKGAATTRHSSIPRSSVYNLKGHSSKVLSIDKYEDSRVKRMRDKSQQDVNRLPGNPSRLISDVNSSIDYKSTMTATASAQLQ